MEIIWLFIKLIEIETSVESWRNDQQRKFKWNSRNGEWNISSSINYNTNVDDHLHSNNSQGEIKSIQVNKAQNSPRRSIYKRRLSSRKMERLLK